MNERQQQIAYFESESKRNETLCAALCSVLTSDFGVNITRADRLCGSVLSKLNHPVDEALHNIRNVPDEDFEQGYTVEDLVTVQTQLDSFAIAIERIQAQIESDPTGPGATVGFMLPMMQQSYDKCAEQRAHISRALELQAKRKEENAA